MIQGHWVLSTMYGAAAAVGELRQERSTIFCLTDNPKSRQVTCVGMAYQPSFGKAIRDAQEVGKAPVQKLLHGSKELSGYFRFHNQKKHHDFFVNQKGWLFITYSDQDLPSVFTSPSNLLALGNAPGEAEIIVGEDRTRNSKLPFKKGVTYTMDVAGYLHARREPTGVFGVIPKTTARSIKPFMLTDGSYDGFLVCEGRLLDRKPLAAIFCPDLVKKTIGKAVEQMPLNKDQVQIVCNKEGAAEIYQGKNMEAFAKRRGVTLVHMPELGEFYAVCTLDHLPRFGIDPEELVVMHDPRGYANPQPHTLTLAGCLEPALAEVA